MAINPHLTTVLKAGVTYYRITSPQFHTNSPTHHRRVVNGQGAARNPVGSRYAHGLVPTVYLANDLETCLAERMFYFHREVLPQLDQAHITGFLPPFQLPSVLWEMEFKDDVTDLADLTRFANAFGIFPALMLNPSQDYLHLKEARARIQGAGYAGLVAPSARSAAGGMMTVIFGDQSKNVAVIRPHPMQSRLICTGSPTKPFANHVTDSLDFTAGEVFFPHSPTISGIKRSGWFRVKFNH